MTRKALRAFVMGVLWGVQLIVVAMLVRRWWEQEPLYSLAVVVAYCSWHARWYHLHRSARLFVFKR